MRPLFDRACPMRDGIRLSADVFLPDDTAPVAAILVRTPYDNTRGNWFDLGCYFAANGYAFVCQDVRGRGDSDGTFLPWLSDFADGYDTVEWVAAQPWCNGRVGMLGGSYMAWVQWTALTQRPPHLVTLATSGSPGRWLRDWPYRWGAFWAEDYLEWIYRVSGRSYQPSSFVDWHTVHANRVPREFDTLVGRPMAHWQEMLAHPILDDYWAALAITGYDTFNLPVLHITGWYDACAPGEFHHFHEMVEKSPAPEKQTLLLGAWDHGGACTTGQAVTGTLELGVDATIDLKRVWLDWFNTWLQPERATPSTWPRVRYYAMGANRWREADAWPPSTMVRTEFFLSNGGGSLTREPPVAQTTQSYTYDPNDPTPGMEKLSGGPLPEWSPRETAFLHTRSDVLVFTSEVAESPLEIAGPVHLILYAASDAPDTDFAALLTDVDLAGRSHLLSHGILRASFRESLHEPKPLESGVVYEMPIELADIGHDLLPGHRLRVIVLSCLFPYYHPNPNTGDLYAGETADRRVVANQTIFSGGATPSRLVIFARSG